MKKFVKIEKHMEVAEKGARCPIIGFPRFGYKADTGGGL